MIIIKFPQEEYNILRDEIKILDLALSRIANYKTEVFGNMFAETFNKKYDQNQDYISPETHPEFWSKYLRYIELQDWNRLEKIISSKLELHIKKRNEMYRNGSFALARYLNWKDKFSISSEEIPESVNNNKEIQIVFKKLSTKKSRLYSDPNNEILAKDLVEETKIAFNKLKEFNLNIPTEFPEFK